MATKKKSGLILTQNDIDIFNYVFQCRVLTIEQLMALTGRSRRKLNERLVRLVARKYLHQQRLPFLHKLKPRHSVYLTKNIYTLNRGAALELAILQKGTTEDLDKQVKSRRLSTLYLEHFLMLSDIHVVLLLAGRDSPISVAGWRNEDKTLQDSVTFQEDNKQVKLPIRPDAFFTLEDSRRTEGGNQVHYFLEADRSTTTLKRFQRKIRAYGNYFKQGLHIEKFGVNNVRVVTICLTPERALSLRQATAEVMPTLPRNFGRFFYFTDVGYFSQENPTEAIGDIFLSARDPKHDVRFPFVPLLTEGE